MHREPDVIIVFVIVQDVHVSYSQAAEDLQSRLISFKQRLRSTGQEARLCTRWFAPDLAMHLVSIAAWCHCREHLLLNAVSLETVQHCIAPVWDALQQRLHKQQNCDQGLHTSSLRSSLPC